MARCASASPTCSRRSSAASVRFFSGEPGAWGTSRLAQGPAEALAKTGHAALAIAPVPTHEARTIRARSRGVSPAPLWVSAGGSSCWMSKSANSHPSRSPRGQPVERSQLVLRVYSRGGRRNARAGYAGSPTQISASGAWSVVNRQRSWTAASLNPPTRTLPQPMAVACSAMLWAMLPASICA